MLQFHGGFLRKPFGVMVSSTDQTPQVPVMFFLIVHYFERPASSVRLVKAIHLRALPQYWLIRETVNTNTRLLQAGYLYL